MVHFGGWAEVRGAVQHGFYQNQPSSAQHRPWDIGEGRHNEHGGL